MTIITAFCCLLLSAFISGSEIAFFGLTPSEIDEIEDESDHPRYKKVLKLLRDNERLLATILIGNNMVNITMVVLLTYSIGQVVTFGNDTVSFVIQTVVLTFLLLLFGEIFPKLVARGRSLAWVAEASGAMMVLYKMFAPLAKFMVQSGGFVNKLVSKRQENISTEQLEKALEISDINDGQQKDMLEGILSFGEKEVGDIMISRVDVTAIEYHDTWPEVMEIILRTGYSRIPVYDTSQDTIRGILYSKDLLPYIDNNDKDFEWQSLLRKAYFVPESRMIDDLLEDFRKRKIHIAIVVDEYGCTQGIVTLEDIIEEIVGEIDDEYDEAHTLWRKIGNGCYMFEAKIPLGDFCHVLEVEEESLGDIGEAETLAGLLLEIKGDFPAQGEILECGKLRFQIVRMERHRILKVRVTTV